MAEKRDIEIKSRARHHWSYGHGCQTLSGHTAASVRAGKTGVRKTEGAGIL